MANREEKMKPDTLVTVGRRTYKRVSGVWHYEGAGALAPVLTQAECELLDALAMRIREVEELREEIIAVRHYIRDAFRHD